MKLSEFKSILHKLNKVSFEKEDGSKVPDHYHLTEVGRIHKNFIDCGGVLRQERKVSFQLFTADDTDHRLKAQKIMKIIELSEEKLGLKDEEIEVEYQGATIGKYGLEFNGTVFILKSLQTDCLAKEKCGIPPIKEKRSLASLGRTENQCTPGGGCC